MKAPRLGAQPTKDAPPPFHMLALLLRLSLSLPVSWSPAWPNAAASAIKSPQRPAAQHCSLSALALNGHLKRNRGFALLRSTLPSAHGAAARGHERLPPQVGARRVDPCEKQGVPEQSAVPLEVLAVKEEKSGGGVLGLAVVDGVVNSDSDSDSHSYSDSDYECDGQAPPPIHFFLRLATIARSSPLVWLV